MKVLLDIDGVLADFVGGACRLHGVDNPYDKQENLGHYEIQDLIGISGPPFWDPMGEEFWAGLDVYPWAHQIVHDLEALYGLDNICLLTSPVRTPGCTRGKMHWIETHFPMLDRQFLIGPMKEVCAHGNSILFDDSESNCHKFRKAGGRAFLVPGRWNRKYRELDPYTAINTFLMHERQVLDASR